MWKALDFAMFADSRVSVSVDQLQILAKCLLRTACSTRNSCNILEAIVMASPVITCTIKYARFGADKLDRSTWKPFTIKVPMSTTTQDFDRQMQPKIVERLRKDKKLLQKIRSTKRLLLYQTEIWVDYCGMNSFRIGHEEDHTFETLADLYESPNIEGKRLNTDLNVGHQIPRPHYSNQPRETQRFIGRTNLGRRSSFSRLLVSMKIIGSTHTCD